MIKHINKENFKTEILDSKEPILVDFSQHGVDLAIC